MIEHSRSHGPRQPRSRLCRSAQSSFLVGFQSNPEPDLGVGFGVQSSQRTLLSLAFLGATDNDSLIIAASEDGLKSKHLYFIYLVQVNLIRRTIFSSTRGLGTLLWVWKFSRGIAIAGVPRVRRQRQSHGRRLRGWSPPTHQLVSLFGITNLVNPSSFPLQS